jgi:exopolysaccharide biosynthesis protein
VWLLTVDGRGQHAPVSRYGATYLQVAGLAKALGATDAVMLDGGGSTTMAMRDADGGVRRIDAPSDTPQRPVPDGLVVIPR